MDYLNCTVERITYHSRENGYSVLRCSAKKHRDLVTAVGVMPEVTVGSSLFLGGAWKVHPKYGEQFQVERFEESMPETAEGVEKYLGSGLIKGIGPVSAKRIVEAFGTEALNIIEEDPDRLLSVNGIGKATLKKIKTSWEAQKEIKNVMLFLQSLGSSTGLAVKIFKAYGADSIKKIKENPYRLADDIWGIGFKTSDQIAMGLGFEKSCYFRLRSGLIYTLNAFSNQGHCYARWKQLVDAAGKILETDTAELDITLDHMIKERDLIKEENEDAIYLPAMYYAEIGTAKKINYLLSEPQQMDFMVDWAVKRVVAKVKISYNETQIKAIRTALTSKIMVLTGGPGTGKTTTTLGIISAFREEGKEILLAAPTGRASKRLSEATGMQASTIHRLLEFGPDGRFGRNEDNKLEGDVLILDECSMIDIILMYNLLKAVPKNMSIILVGDVDQLPSVGAGNVLKDIINSGRVPVVKLTQIFRQAQDSQIIMNAHRINAGTAIDVRGGKNSDFFFAEVGADLDPMDPDYNEAVNSKIDSLLLKFCTKSLPEYYHMDPVKDIQVLAPSRKGICGTGTLNQYLQAALNPGQPCLKRGTTEYRLADKVIQIRNNYDKGVFNGDVGIICEVNQEDGNLAVEYDGRKVPYDISELDEVELAYSITIHKSQGSEYPIVVIPLTMSNYIMLNRNLLYTGVTRAKKILVLIGEKRALRRAIKNKTAAIRNTGLMERLAVTA